MENKNLTRAKEILNSGEILNINKYTEDLITKAMCQLAEEIEFEMIAKYINLINSVAKNNLYTKERVEELLQKQRELSTEKARLRLIDNYTGKIQSEFMLSCFSYDMETDSMSKIEINKDSILNAKLKID